MESILQRIIIVGVALLIPFTIGVMLLDVVKVQSPTFNQYINETFENFKNKTRLSADEERQMFLKYHPNEVKYCDSLGMKLNDSYFINNNQIIACSNQTGVYTYQFSDSNPHDGSFAGGLLVGLLLSK